MRPRRTHQLVNCLWLWMTLVFASCIFWFPIMHMLTFKKWMYFKKLKGKIKKELSQIHGWWATGFSWLHAVHILNLLNSKYRKSPFNRRRFVSKSRFMFLFSRRLVTKLFSTLLPPHGMDSSPPGSSVHGIPRQKYQSGLPFPSPGDLPNPGIKPASPALAGGFFMADAPGKPHSLTGQITK